jgi:hypothetical protein
VAKKRTAPRAASRKTAKKKGVKKAPKRAAAPSRPTVVQPGPAYQTDKGVDLRPLKKAIRLTIELLAKAQETPKVAGALESLVAVQQRLTEECKPDMMLPNS